MKRKTKKFKFIFGFPDKWDTWGVLDKGGPQAQFGSPSSDQALPTTVGARTSFRREPLFKQQSLFHLQWKSGSTSFRRSVCAAGPLLKLSHLVMTAASSEWPLPSIDQKTLFLQHSLWFKLKLIMQMINYSTKAQKSPLLTPVLLISKNTFLHIQTSISIFRSRCIVSVPWANLDMWPGLRCHILYPIILHFIPTALKQVCSKKAQLKTKLSEQWGYYRQTSVPSQL